MTGPASRRSTRRFPLIPSRPYRIGSGVMEIRFLSAHDVEQVAPEPAETIAAVETVVRAQGNGEVVLEPRVHLEPGASFNGHWNVLRAFVAPLGTAGVKVVGDFVDNYLRGLPSELGLLTLYEPETGAPTAIVDAAEPILRTAWIAEGAFVVPYGTMSAVELDLLSVMSKVVVDDWEQCKPGGRFGSLRAHVEQGLLTKETLHGELGDVVVGRVPGRETDDERILLWHRGIATCDVALGALLVERAAERGVGTILRYR